MAISKVPLLTCPKRRKGWVGIHTDTTHQCKLITRPQQAGRQLNSNHSSKCPGHVHWTGHQQHPTDSIYALWKMMVMGTRVSPQHHADPAAARFLVFCCCTAGNEMLLLSESYSYHESVQSAAISALLLPIQSLKPFSCSKMHFQHEKSGELPFYKG